MIFDGISRVLGAPFKLVSDPVGAVKDVVGGTMQTALGVVSLPLSILGGGSLFGSSAQAQQGSQNALQREFPNGSPGYW
jgi:hypothetical protein